MANKTIPQLPEQTGKTDNDLLAIVDSGETTTSKIKVSTLLSGLEGNLKTSNGTNSYRTEPMTITDTTGDYSIVAAGTGNTITSTGDSNVIFAGKDNLISNVSSNSAIVGGYSNQINSNSTTIFNTPIMLGGYSNRIVLTGGLWKTSVNIGGTTSDSNNENSFMACGNFSQATGSHSVVFGRSHQVSGENSVSIGGSDNDITGKNSGIYVGVSNTITNERSVIIGGQNNSVGFRNSVIAGGTYNTNNGDSAFICGGLSNNIQGDGNYHSIVGGNNNTINAGLRGSTILNGNANTITNSGGGYAQNYNTIVGGGSNNITSTGTYQYPIILGGSGNDIIDSSNSAILGGNNNTVSGHTNSVVIGGSGLTSNYNSEVQVPNLTIANYASLNFSGDTAAAAAGIVLGQVYHDNGALRVRIT